DAPAVRLAVEPGEKARQGCAVAAMRLVGAADFGDILHRLHQRDGIRPAQRDAAALLDDSDKCVRRGRLIEPQPRLAGCRGRKIGGKGVRLAQIGEALQRVTHRMVELLPVEINPRPALAADDGKASATGTCGTALPRMLKVQASACGSEMTSASARRLPISSRTRASLAAASMPA